MTVSRKVTGTAVSMPRGLLLGNTISIAFQMIERFRQGVL